MSIKKDMITGTARAVMKFEGVRTVEGGKLKVYVLEVSHADAPARAITEMEYGGFSHKPGDEHSMKPSISYPLLNSEGAGSGVWSFSAIVMDGKGSLAYRTTQSHPIDFSRNEQEVTLVLRECLNLNAKKAGRKSEGFFFGCFTAAALLFVAREFGHGVRFDGLSIREILAYAGGIGIAWGSLWFVFWRRWAQAILMAVLAAYLFLNGADRVNDAREIISSVTEFGSEPSKQ